MATLELFFHIPTKAIPPPNSSHRYLSTTLSLLSPFPKPFYISLSPCIFSLYPVRPSLLQNHLSLRNLSRFVPPRTSREFNNGYEEEGEGEEVKEDEKELDDVEASDESDSESYSMIDVDALEQEARNVVREFSSTLFDELRIGVFYC